MVGYIADGVSGNELIFSGTGVVVNGNIFYFANTTQASSQNVATISQSGMQVSIQFIQYVASEL